MKGVRGVPHGMTYKNLQQLAERLAGKLNIDQVKIMAALKEVVREDVFASGVRRETIRRDESLSAVLRARDVQAGRAHHRHRALEGGGGCRF